MAPRYLLLPLLLCTAACSDPIEGRWRGEADIPCGPGITDRVDFEVTGDLDGTGGLCSCTFSFTVDPRNGDTYRFDIDFEGPCLADDGKYDCELKRDGEKLDCNTLGEFDYVEE